MTMHSLQLIFCAFAVCTAAQGTTSVCGQSTQADFVDQETVDRLFDNGDPWIRPVCFEASPCGDVCGCGESVEGCGSAHGGCGDLMKRERLFGDVFGPKSALAEKGIITDFMLGQYWQGVTSGGNQQGDFYGGKVDMYATILGPTLGLNKSFALVVHAETRFGEDVSGAAGSLTTPNGPMLWPLPGDYHGTNITGLSFVQNVHDDSIGITGGKLNVLDLTTGLFPEIAGGRESFVNVNALATALPWFRFVNLSMWGAGAWTYDKEAGGQIGHGFVVFGLDNTSDNWDFSPSFEDGVGMLGWLRFFHEIDGKPGYLMGAVGGATRGYNSLQRNDFLVIPGQGLVSTAQKKPWDVAGYASQVLWQDDCNKARNIRLTVGGTIADDNPSFSNWNAFSRLEGFGLVQSRPGDRMGVAGWYNGLSNNVINLAGTVGFPARDNWGMELYYNREINPWFHVTGDMQILQNSTATTDTSLVLGLRAIIDL